LEKKILDDEQMINFYENLINQYPIVSIEDGLDENDWSGWTKITEALGNSTQIVGDDLTVTNPKKLLQAVEKNAMNSILIKLNQIGTVSETIETINIAKENGYDYIISHRSGETEDTFIADLSVAMGGGQIKTGSVCRTDRTSKYNQLLRIEEKLTSKTFGKNFSFIK
jgi:enolase